MEKTIYDITLALGQSPARRLVTVKRYDSHVTLRMRLVYGGKPYKVTEDCHGVFTARKPDGTVIYNSCSREGNVFLYHLTPQTTAAAGQLRCELKLYGPEEALLTSAAFLMEVEDTVYSGDEELASSREAEALTQLVGSAREGIDRMEQVLQDAEDLVRIDDSGFGENAWSAKRIVETLCPAFDKTAPVVKGYLLRDYPLQIRTTVQKAASELTLTLCGKNLFDFRSGTYPVEFTSAEGEKYKYAGYAIKLPAGVYTIHCEKTPNALDSYFLSVRVINAKGVIIPGDISGSGNLIWGGDSSRKTLTVTIEEGYTLVVYDGTSIGKPNTAVSDIVFTYDNIQLEAGSTATPYEPYRGETHSVDFRNFVDAFNDGAFYDWNTGVMTDEVGEYWQHYPEEGTFENIPDIEAYQPRIIRQFPAFPGENYIYSSAGVVTVSGRQDVAALLQKLTADS